MKRIYRSIIACLLLLFMAFSFSGCSFSFMKNGAEAGNTNPGKPGVGNYEYSDIEPSQVEIKNIPTTDRKELSLVEAVEKVSRSVVAIEMSGGAGAGVIVDIDLPGEEDDNVIYIITCHHVIADQGEITVYIPDQNDKYYNDSYTFTGNIGGTFSSNAGRAVTLVGGDLTSDIAVIKINLNEKAESGSKLTMDKICKSRIPKDDYSVRKGEEVFAIGNPTGMYPGWVCNGIVSTLEAEVSVENVGDMLLMGISATTNPGNSGGGLFNLYGELVGITNAGNTSYEAINFAIPLYTSNKESADVIDNGFVNIAKNLLGTYTNSNYGFVKGKKELFGFTITKGTSDDNDVVGVTSIVKGSIAESAGLKANDIIVAYKKNDQATQSVTTFEAFTSVMSGIKINDVITLTVSRVENKSYGGFVRQETVQKVIDKMVARQYHFANTGSFTNN